MLVNNQILVICSIFLYYANIQPNQTFEDNLLMTPNKCLIECKQVDLRFGLLVQGSVMIAVES